MAKTPGTPSTLAAAPGPARRVRRGDEADAQRMRAALTETALALFSEGGLDAVSMRSLSARLGISAMTPYYYFGSKAQLLSALWQHVLKDLHACVSAAIQRQSGARARLEAYLDAFLDYYETHPDEYRLVAVTQQGGHESEQAGAGQASIFIDLRHLFRATMSAFAAEIGAELDHLKIAEDVVVIMQLGYLQAAVLNRRYPWSERSVLRPACIAQMLLMAERCLAKGAGDACMPTGNP